MLDQASLRNNNNYHQSELYESTTKDSLAETALHKAALHGQQDVVEQLIAMGADVDAQSPGSLQTPLFVAAQQGHIGTIRCLVKAQASTEIRLWNGQSPLYTASQNNQLETVVELIRAQADVDLADQDGTTPLAVAATHGHRQVVEALLAAGARVDISNRSGEGPLHLAIFHQHQTVIDILSKALTKQHCQKDYETHQTAEECSPLFLAALFNCRAGINALIEAGMDINIPSSDGLSALNIAASMDHSGAVADLIRACADLDFQGPEGASSLFVAVSEGNEKIVRMLVNARANVNLSKDTGDTPLHLVSKSGELLIAQILLEAGADPDIANQNGETATLVAVRNGQTALAQLLLQAQSSPDSQHSQNGVAAIHCASFHNLKEALEILTRAMVDVDCQTAYGETGVRLASKRGNADIVKFLVKAAANVNLAESTCGIVPLYSAAETNLYQIALCLLDASACAEKDPRCFDTVAPLHIASQNNNYEIVGLLLSHGADVNKKIDLGSTPLIIAAQNGHGKIVDVMLRSMAETNVLDNNGNCALILAAAGGHRSIVAKLIDAGANVNLINPNTCYSSLMKAAQRGHSQVVKLLASSGAMVDAEEHRGVTALYFAAEKGHFETVQVLVSARANVNKAQFQGVTPLYIASQWGHRDVVKELLRAEADPNLQPMFGDNAYLAATRNGFFEIADLLLDSRFIYTKATMITECRLLIWDCCIGSIEETVRRLATLIRFDVNFEALDGLEQFRNLWNWIKTRWSSSMTKSDLSSLLKAIRNSNTVCEPVSELELSKKLHEALSRSGFVEARAKLQAAVADVLQQIVQSWKPELGFNDIFVVGSYSEGWGNSLSCLDGRTDVASDIDVTELIPGRLYHLRGFCHCDDVKDTEEYKNGHILCEGYASSPATPESGSALRPAIDRVSACRLCCYPPIGPLQPARLAKSCISSNVLQSLRDEVATSPCHVVHAAPPGQAGSQLRVSTTFLERRLLRSLNTLQGQLFVVLKYLIKKVISKKVQGLKAYHAKTVTFRMVEETPEEHWRPENLVILIRRSLQLLLDSVEGSCCSDNTDGRIMEHFFLLDAALYLKGSDRNTPQEIIQVLKESIDQLPKLLMQLISNLGQLSGSAIFYYTPFHIVPLQPTNKIDSQTGGLEYHEIYMVVRECLLELATQSRRSLAEQISEIPDYALAARECLRALNHLKFGQTGLAVKVLENCSGHQVSRGIEFPPERSLETEATTELVWEHLKTKDCAWRFCFWFAEPLKLDFLPKFVAECFPSQMVNFANCFYVNFDAWLTCLRFELVDGRSAARETAANAWCDRLLDRHDEADAQECLMAMQYCSGNDRLMRLLRRYGRSFTDQAKRMAQKILMLENEQLRFECLRTTITDVETAIFSTLN